RGSAHRSTGAAGRRGSPARAAVPPPPSSGAGPPSRSPVLPSDESAPPRSERPPSCCLVVSSRQPARGPPPLVGSPAAGQIVDGARAERALLRGEPRHEGGHLLGPADPAHGDLRDQEVHRAPLHLLQEL